MKILLLGHPNNIAANVRVLRPPAPERHEEIEAEQVKCPKKVVF